MLGSDEIVRKRMLNNDAFSHWLGIQVLEVNPDQCVAQLVIRQDMLNGFGLAHGAISYALADSVLAFAANAGGRQALTLSTDVMYTQKVELNDTIRASATLVHKTKQYAKYTIYITNQHGNTVSIFNGLVHLLSHEWQ